MARRLIESLEKMAGKPIRADTHEKALPAFKRLGFKVLKEYTEDGIRWFLVEKD